MGALKKASFVLMFVASLLSLALSTWTFEHRPKPAAVVAPAPPPPHLMGSLPSGSYEWYDNARHNGQFYVTDPLFGAKGDCATDDTAAIQAANAAGQAINGGVVYFPTPTGGCYKVTAETLVQYRAHWKGDAGNLAQNIIRAYAPMRSIMALRSTYSHPLPEGGGSYRAVFEDLTFDANETANNAVIFIGAAYSLFPRVRFLNAIQAGVREAIAQAALTLSAVTATVPGGSPAGVTVSQPDPNFFGFTLGIGTAGTYPIYMKVTTGGVRDVAQFAISTNGGSTYSAFTQPVSAVANVAQPDNVGQIASLSGVQAQFPSGTYHVGDYYSFNYTSTNTDTLFPQTANWALEFEDDIFEQDGWTYPTAAVTGSFSPNKTTMGGSVSLVAGSNLIVGSGTSFLSATAAAGSGFSRGAIWVNTGGLGTTYEVMGALTDTVLALTPADAGAVAITGGPYDFAFALGGGDYDDGNSEISEHLFIAPRFDGVSIGAQFGMYVGSTIINPEFTLCNTFAATFGGSSTYQSRTNLLEGDRVNSQCRSGYYFAPNSSGTWLEPHSDAGIFKWSGQPSFWIVQTTGRVYPLIPAAGNVSTNLPVQTLQFPAPGAFTFTTGAETIPAPGLTGPTSGGGTFIEINSTSALTLTGVPVLASAGTDGVVVYLLNVGAYPITIQAYSWGSSHIYTTGQYVTLTQNSMLPLISRGTAWVQTGNVVSTYANTVGDQSGPGNKTIKTTNATPVTLWDAYVAALGGLNRASLMKFDLKAQARNGTDAAFWNDCAVFDDGNGTRMGFSCATYAATAGNAAAWTMAVNNGGSYERIVVTGDASGNPVYWSIDITQKSPSASF